MIHKLNKRQKIEIENEIKNLLEKKDEIIFSYLHGSFVLNLPIHDVDLAIFMVESYCKKIDPIDYEIQLSIELELKIKLPIDVKIINFAPLSFQYNVTRGKILFNKNKQILFDFIEMTWMKYFDFKFYVDTAFKYLYSIK